MRDKTKQPEKGDVLGEGKDQRTVESITLHTVTYRDAKGQIATIGKKSWRDYFRKHGYAHE